MDQLLDDTSNGNEQRCKQEGEGIHQHEDECRSGEPHGKQDNEDERGVFSGPDVEAFANTLSESVVQISVRKGDGNMSYGTGFVVFSGNFRHILDLSHLNHGSSLMAEQTYTFVMTANHVLSTMLDSTVQLKFFREDNWCVAEILYTDSRYDLAMLYVKDGRERACLSFSDENIYTSTKVYLLAHPLFYNSIQPHMLTCGSICGICELKTFEELGDDCALVMYGLCSNKGTSGGPIVDQKGQVVAVHIGAAGDFAFGVSVGNIKTFLKECFRLEMDIEMFHANDVFRHSES